MPGPGAPGSHGPRGSSRFPVPRGTAQIGGNHPALDAPAAPGAPGDNTDQGDHPDTRSPGGCHGSGGSSRLPVRRGMPQTGGLIPAPGARLTPASSRCPAAAGAPRRGGAGGSARPPIPLCFSRSPPPTTSPFLPRSVPAPPAPAPAKTSAPRPSPAAARRRTHFSRAWPSEGTPEPLPLAYMARRRLSAAPGPAPRGPRRPRRPRRHPGPARPGPAGCGRAPEGELETAAPPPARLFRQRSHHPPRAARRA